MRWIRRDLNESVWTFVESQRYSHRFGLGVDLGSFSQVVPDLD